jgi:medium-chain acyl-[acyl-carrier-protein] hydrolase
MRLHDERNKGVTSASGTQSDLWIAKTGRQPGARVRLFCFPYAGASSAVFRTWPSRFSGDVDAVLVELPGRGSRMREQCFTDLGDLVEATYHGICHAFDRPFAFFGHSMGALLAFELTRLLRRRGEMLPIQLFLSGHAGPRVPRDDSPRHGLPREEFIAELRRMNGTPAEVLENPELMDILLPLLRADFSVSETYKYTSEPPLSTPMTVFGGLHDKHISSQEFRMWSEECEGPFALRMIPGDHFFLHSQEAALVEEIHRGLARVQQKANTKT